MSRERKLAERIARKKQYRDSSGPRTLRTATLSSEERIDNTSVDLQKQLNALPGKPEEKYMVVLHCSDNNFYSYPIYGCPNGFTAAMQDAINKHKRMDRPEIQRGIVKGIGNTSFNPPDELVQMMAMGCKVVVTNRLENKQVNDPNLRGKIGQGGR